MTDNNSNNSSNSNKKYAYKRSGYFGGLVGEITEWFDNETVTLHYRMGGSTVASVNDIIYCVKTPQGWITVPCLACKHYVEGERCPIISCVDCFRWEAKDKGGDSNA